MLKYINTWKLNNMQRKILYFIYHAMYRDTITERCKVRCLGIGYPHWKGMVFTCNIVFENDTIGLDNNIRVYSKDFVAIK